MSGCFEFLQVFLPVLILVLAHIVQCFPGVDTRIVAVIKGRLDGITADRFDVQNGDIFLALLQDTLAGSVALYFCRG